jgi:excisionase family DNA binding protein
MIKRATKRKNAAQTYTIREIAKILNVGLNEAYAAAHRGELPIIKIGRSIRVLKPAFDRLLEGAPGTPRES